MKNKPDHLHIIVAPHVDDEVIGCFDILSNPDNKCAIVYSNFDLTDERAEEIKRVKDKFDNIKFYFRNRSIPNQLIDPNNYLHFPDPFIEHHPHHRLIGLIGYELFQKGYPVFFYSINMQAPYIYNIDNWQEKKKVLNELYPSQKSLWENDHKYFLFEGHCQYVPGRVWCQREN